MAKQLSNTQKVIKWIFDIPYEYNRTKQKWQQQSAAYKILSVFITIFFLGLSCALFYLTGKAFGSLSGKDLEAIVKSLILFFGIMILTIADIIFIVNMYRQLVFNVMVAFICRPPKKNKNTAISADDTKIVADEKTTEEQPGENSTNTDISKPEDLKYANNKAGKSKTSRGFDTTIGWINIAFIVIYTAGLILAFGAGYGK